MGALVPVFDGHNDVLTRLRRSGGDAARAFLDGDGTGHIDLPRARGAGFAGGLFAMFADAPGAGADHASNNAMMQGASYDIPLPVPLETAYAQGEVTAMMATLTSIERESGGGVRICRDAAALRDCIERGVLAAVLHMEGAEAIDPDFSTLHALSARGLRSLGPVWSRPSAFGHGVPFRFPSGPDTGPGLTPLGRRLVRECNALRIMVDLSHLTERGFWDAAEQTSAPLVATHSNAHAVCTHARNLTDGQLAAIRASGGMVGVNFGASFLRADGRLDTATPLEQVLRHFDHLLEHAGEDSVGFGSDFDGATIPGSIGGVEGLPRIVEAMRAHGYGEPLIEKLCWRNWVRTLERAWS